MNQYLPQLFASAYGSCSYGTAQYDASATCSASAASAAGGASSGTLADTGFAVLAALTVACVLIFVSLVVHFWFRSKQNANS